MNAPRADNLPDKVAAYLRGHCVGRQHAQTKAAIADDLGIDQRELHDVIAALIKSQRLAICSACREPMGYYLATVAWDRLQGVHALRRRGIAILRRAKALKQAPIYPTAPRIQGNLF